MDPAELLALAKAQVANDCVWVEKHWLIGSQISETDRSTLVDWMVQVQDYLDLSDATLHLAVANIDRVLSKVDFDPGEFQLLGLVSLMVAAKVEEDIIPSVSNLLTMMNGVYSKTDFARLELELLLALDWRTRKTTSATFLHLYRENAGAGRKVVFRLAKAILDLSLTQEWHGTVEPSKMASCSLAAASCILGHDWPAQLVEVTGYKLSQLNYIMLACLRLVSRPDLAPGVREKHATLLAKVDRNVKQDAVESVIMRHLAKNRRSICG